MCVCVCVCVCVCARISQAKFASGPSILTLNCSITTSESSRTRLTCCLAFCPACEYEEHKGIRGLVVLSVPAHDRHLRAGAVGEVHLQHGPVHHGGHGHLHLVRLCAHSRASGAGVLLGTEPRRTL